MKVEAARQEYYDSSGTASDLTRKLGFAGLAAVWLFTDSARTADQNIADLGAWLTVAGALFVAGLGLDVFQYSSKATLFGGKVRIEERRLWKSEKRELDDDSELEIPGWINRVPITFFSLKQLCVVFGYGALLIAVVTISPAAPDLP